jgi:hypothetical protein
MVKINLQEWEKQNLGPLVIHASMLVTSQMCSLLIVKFSFARHVDNLNVTQQHSQVTHYLSESTHITIVASLKDWPNRQSLSGVSSSMSSCSGASKFATFATVQSNCVCRHISF